MNYKKGFTLVELIAVIAILGVILLIVVPNVVENLGNGKKDTFVRQVQSIWREAEKQFTVDFAKSRKNNLYCDSEHTSLGCKALDVNKNKVNYMVGLNDDGEVVYMAVGDKNFCYINPEPTSMKINKSQIFKGTLSCDGEACSCSDSVIEIPVDFTPDEDDNNGGSGGNGGNTNKPRYVYWHYAFLRQSYEVPVGSLPPENVTESLDDIMSWSNTEFIRSKVDKNGNSIQHDLCWKWHGQSMCFEYDYWIKADSRSDLIGSQYDRVLDVFKDDVYSAFGINPEECYEDNGGFTCKYATDYYYENYYVSIYPGGGSYVSHSRSSSGDNCSINDSDTASCISY